MVWIPRDGSFTSHKEKTPTRKRAVLPHRFLGIVLAVLAILASLVLSVTPWMVKLTESIPSLEVTFIPVTLLLVFSLPSMTFFKDKFIQIPWKHSKCLLLRGASSVTVILAPPSFRHPRFCISLVFWDFPSILCC